MYGKSLKFIARITPLLVWSGWLFQAWAGIAAVAALTVIPFSVFAASGPTNLISWGWNSPTAEYVNNNLTSMEGRPFDGVVPTTIVTHGYYFGALALTNIPFTRADVQSDIDHLKTASSSNVLTQNFYQLYVAISNEPPDWFDDWTTPLNNIRLMAQIMKEAGLKGVLIDTETYNSSFFDYETRKYSATRTFTEYKAQVRLRGQELVQAINSVVPNISLLATYCFSLTLGGGHPNYDLLDAFCDGMVQGADVGTILHEIAEPAYAYKSAQQFSDLYTDLRSAAVKASETPAKLFTNYRIGFGIWVDYRSNDRNCADQNDWNTTNFTCNWFSPTEFKNSVFEALKHADTGSYVWIYNQIPNWWTGNALPAEYLTALRDAKNLYITELNGDFAPPTVSLTQPADGSSVSDTVALSALAVDNVGVAGVQFQLDGRNIGVEDISAPYAVSWDVKSVSNGFHTLSAIARDAAGNTAISAAVTIAVNNPFTISDAVAHWKLDETSGTAVSDSSRNGNTGTLINSPSWTPGKIDGGLQFHNEASGYVSVPDHPLLKPAHDITLSAWIYPTAYNPPGYYQGIIFKGGKQYGCCYQPAYALGLLPTGELRFAMGDSTSYEAYTGPKIPLNAWTHVAAVRMNTNAITLYINGSPVSGGGVSALEEFFYTSAPLYLAVSTGGWGGNRFDGTIDDVRIYSRGLQAAEVQALYNLGTGGAGGPTELTTEPESPMMLQRR
jgi:Concanavalin A-like lectin/glucanases superfamily/Bacterial Ig domain